MLLELASDREEQIGKGDRMRFLTDTPGNLKIVRAACTWLNYESDILVDRQGKRVGFYDFRTVEGDIYRVARWPGSLPTALRGRLVPEDMIYKALAYPLKDTWQGICR